MAGKKYLWPVNFGIGRCGKMLDFSSDSCSLTQKEKQQ